MRWLGMEASGRNVKCERCFEEGTSRESARAKRSTPGRCLFVTTTATDTPTRVSRCEDTSYAVLSQRMQLRHADCEARLPAGDRLHFKALVAELFPDE